MEDRSEEIRLRYLYRRLILRGKVRVTLDAGRSLVGPDCAYHLYAAGKDQDGTAPACAPQAQEPPGS